MLKTETYKTLTLTENSDAHGTEYLIGALNHVGVVEVVYALGDAGGYLGVVNSIEIERDDDGDYSFAGADEWWPDLAGAVEAAKRRLA